MLSNIMSGGHTMSENGFVQMLLEAAGGSIADQRDMELACAGAQWALSHGWRPYLGAYQGYVGGNRGLEFWVNDTPTRDALMVMVRVAPGTAWKVHARYPVAHLGHALDILAAEELIPARFSTIGRRALEGHAEALEGAADTLGDVVRRAYCADRNRDAELVGEARIASLLEAAESARRYAGAELAVLR